MGRDTTVPAAGLDAVLALRGAAGGGGSLVLRFQLEWLRNAAELDRLRQLPLRVHNKAFGTAFRNNLLIIVVSLLVQLPLALALALVLAQRFRGAVALRMVFFLPYILAEIATGLMFSFVYDGDYGLLASIYRQFGAEAPHLLASPQTAFLAILVVIVWKYFGFHMMLFIAALQGLDRNIVEAARIDGASRWNRCASSSSPRSIRRSASPCSSPSSGRCSCSI